MGVIAGIINFMDDRMDLIAYIKWPVDPRPLTRIGEENLRGDDKTMKGLTQ